MPQPLRAIDAASVRCVSPSEGVLLLMVSDRPNQFLCASLSSALAHGLRPTLLGWDPSSWLDAHKKPWSYHLGAKLVLPLEYLRRCGAGVAGAAARARRAAARPDRRGAGATARRAPWAPAAAG